MRGCSLGSSRTAGKHVLMMTHLLDMVAEAVLSDDLLKELQSKHM